MFFKVSGVIRVALPPVRWKTHGSPWKTHDKFIIWPKSHGKLIDVSWDISVRECTSKPPATKLHLQS